MDKVLEKIRSDLSAQYVRDLFDYDPTSGCLAWKHRPLAHFVSQRACSTWNAMWAGKDAAARADGYVRVSIDAKRYYAHRVIWLWVIGEWPKLRIDHKDGNPRNLHWVNLRLASASNNSTNSITKRTNTSGAKGVHMRRGKYRSEIVVAGVRHRLGSFDTVDAASVAYKVAAGELHGDFRRSSDVDLVNHDR